MTALEAGAPPSGLTFQRPQRLELQSWLPQLREWLLPGSCYGLEHTWPAVFRSDGRAEFYALKAGEQLVGFLARRDVDLVGTCSEPGSRMVRTALIGSVATHPDHRGQGIARWLLDQACNEARGAGCAASLLWAERPGLYSRAGYSDAGAMDVVALDIGNAVEGDAPQSGSPSSCGPTVEVFDVAGRSLGVVREATVMDRRRLLPLHEAKPWRVKRTASEMDLHLSTPGSRTFVLDAGGQLLAYGSIGKGADLQGWWHELGGPDEFVAPLLPAAMTLAGQRQGLLQLPPYRLALPELLGPMVLERCAVPVAMRRLFSSAGAIELFVDGFDSV